MKRTMQQLENDLTRHEVTRWADLAACAIEAGNANDAARFARQAVQAVRELVEAECGAELQAEPMLRMAQNAASTVRWSNETYAEAASAAGGVLIIRKAA